MSSTAFKFTSDEQLDHILGVVYGNCCGDAIGLLTEFMNKEQAKLYYGDKDGLEFSDAVPDMHRSRWKHGDWTDDTDQMILIVDTIINKHKVDAEDFGHRLLQWAYKGFPELGDNGGMGIGATTKHVLHMFEDEKELTKEDPHHAARTIWEKTGREVAPNGAVMRTSVLGVYMHNDLDAVIENTKQIAKVSHYDPRCQASCVAVTSAIALMLQRKPEHLLANGELNIDSIIECSYKLAKPLVEKKKHRKELKSHIYCKKIKELKLDESSKIGYTYKAMGAGFWALKQTDFRVAMEAITMEAGDADTNGAVAGAMLGCKLGFNRIPKKWTASLLHKSWLDEKLCKFFDIAGIEYNFQPAEED